MKIRKAFSADRDTYLAMAKDFYDSNAVMHKIPDSRLEETFDYMMSDDTYGSIYIIEQNERKVGYLLTAVTYSQEAGGRELWLEELYIIPEYRGKGIGHEVFSFAEGLASEGFARIRLEVEPENCRATELYKRLGYEGIPYRSMIKELL